MSRADKLFKKASVYDARAQRIANLRLLVVGAYISSLILAALRPELELGLPSTIVFVIVLIAVVSRHRRNLRLRRRYFEASLFYRRTSARINGSATLSHWDSNQILERSEEQRVLIEDLQLAGKNAPSLLGLLDETISAGGQNKLLDWMLTPPVDIGQARARQQLVQVAALNSHRFRKWLALAQVHADFSDKHGIAFQKVPLKTAEMSNFLQHPFLPPSFRLQLVFILALWILAIAGTVADRFGGVSTLAWLLPLFSLLNFAATASTIKALSKTDGILLAFSRLEPMLKVLEMNNWPPELRSVWPSIQKNRPTSRLRSFRFFAAALSIQNNFLVQFLVNSVLPWSLVFAWACERNRERLSATIEPCWEEFHLAECLASLAIFADPSLKMGARCWPEWQPQSKLEFNQLAHPLLARAKAVANDLKMSGKQTLGLITGSNMSGKSTFLRTVGLNQVLANLGAPVFALRFVTYPFRVDSCIQISDSLRDGFSYFYSEVRRLKSILQRAGEGQPTLFLIDEIFRGTNNRERQIGSRAVMRSLVKNPDALGFISTHDLELTSMSTKHPEIYNLHFREDIESQELVFHYRLLMGPSPTTNALIIMEKEGLQILDVDRT